jgi:hypothetical protein
VQIKRMGRDISDWEGKKIAQRVVLVGGQGNKNGASFCRLGERRRRRKLKESENLWDVAAALMLLERE